MARTDAVAAVSGVLFEEGWSRLRGSPHGLHRRRQMTRAGMGHAPAIFKPIKSGGCHTRAQLRAQLEYLTTKSSHIIDSRGTYDGLEKLDARQIDVVAKRFSSRWSERFVPKMGHTTHMLMAFPVGTKGTDVRDIAGEVCERFFENGSSRFDYLVAVHEDRAHPHAHVVLNRRSPDGEMFYLGRDHRFNYDAFREAMVEAAEKRGLRLEATRRLERGVTTFKAPIEEIHRAKEEGRAPVERARVGRSLDTALAEIARHSQTYRSLAAEASAENREDVAQALFRAGEILARGGHIEARGDIYMPEEQTFDDLVSDFSAKVQRVERVIEDSAPKERAAMERRLNEVLRTVSHLNPLGERSHTLDASASEGGVYSQVNIDRANLDRLIDPQTRARIDTALRETGLSSAQVVSRIEVGADNAALERQWLGEDLRTIARTDNLDLSKKDEREQAIDRLDDVHAKLGTVLAEVRVLRIDGVVHDEDGPENDAAFERYAEEMRERAVADHQTAVDQARTEEISERLALKRGTASWEDEGIARAERAQAIEEAEPAAVRRDRALAEAPKAGIIDAVMERMRADPLGRSLRDEDEARAFRQEVEAELNADALDRLRHGDEGVFEANVQDRLDRLHLAKTYLESDAATAQSGAIERVREAIADEEIDAQRARHSLSHGEKGATHG